MQLTDEQIKILESKGNIKINAVAGSGKTTSLIEYARVKADARILYLAFNKSVKLEAITKFKEVGLKNVRVETAHSLAYSYIVKNSRYKLCQGYTSFQTKNILKIKPFDEKLSDFVLANHVNKFVNYFCNSTAKQVKELNYSHLVQEPKAKIFVQKYYDDIEKLTRLFLAKMDKGEIEIIHDFYLKKFQLLNPQLKFDFILFDEGQDASPTMLDVFLKQNSTKVIVGDIHQQIYGWRFAINSLDKVNFKDYYLTKSFRFNSEIAELAIKILKTKEHFTNVKAVNIKGLGENDKLKSKVIIARTNVTLLLKAIELLIEDSKISKVYFEGNISSYTYASDGGSIYDILNLYNDRHKLIRDKLIKSMKDFEQLEEYADKTDDAQLKMIIQVVKKYKNELPYLIKQLKINYVNDNEKQEADMIFSTVHKSKGMEYDHVNILNDFISEEKIKNLVNDKEAKFDPKALAEEVNMLYVAITRTKNFLKLPFDLLPLSEQTKYEKYNNIFIADLPMEGSKNNSRESSNNHKKERSKDYQNEIKKTHKQAYQKWTEELDDRLTEMFCFGTPIDEIAECTDRTVGAIRSRIKKLELRDKYN
ncbi:MAG: DNA helicase [Bacteroidetes bacterium]|nr:MAG: DNA helicase [Bacteroidota bacterium]